MPNSSDYIIHRVRLTINRIHQWGPTQLQSPPPGWLWERPYGWLPRNSSHYSIDNSEAHPKYRLLPFPPPNCFEDGTNVNSRLWMRVNTKLEEMISKYMKSAFQHNLVISIAVSPATILTMRYSDCMGHPLKNTHDPSLMNPVKSMRDANTSGVYVLAVNQKHQILMWY